MSAMGITPSFWQGKKVFVTGHTGFKGSWLAEILLTLGAEVTGYALAPPTSPSHFDVLGLANRLKAHHEADIRDRQKLNDAIIKAQPEIVFHLAAQPLVRLSYAEPVETFETNIMGTVGILDGIRQHAPQCRAVVCITSDKCYLNEDHGRPFAEDDRLGGQDPYSASKAGAEVAAEAFEYSYFQHTQTALATVRAGNVIGGGDWAADRLIPDVARAARDGRPVVIRSPKATRPWQHVLEPLRGYMMMAEKLYSDGRAYRGGWNFGPYVADAQPVSIVLTELQRSLPFELQLDTAPQPHEALLLSLDISKAENRLGWRPQLRLAGALDLTGGWYKTFNDGGDVRALTQAQIKEYFGLS